jgi:hypothetical protein
MCRYCTSNSRNCTGEGAAGRQMLMPGPRSDQQGDRRCRSSTSRSSRGFFNAEHKRRIVTRLTDTMIEIEGENMRRDPWTGLRRRPVGGRVRLRLHDLRVPRRCRLRAERPRARLDIGVGSRQQFISTPVRGSSRLESRSREGLQRAALVPPGAAGRSDGGRRTRRA